MTVSHDHMSAASGAVQRCKRPRIGSAIEESGDKSTRKCLVDNFSGCFDHPKAVDNKIQTNNIPGGLLKGAQQEGWGFSVDYPLLWKLCLPVDG